MGFCYIEISRHNPMAINRERLEHLIPCGTSFTSHGRCINVKNAKMPPSSPLKLIHWTLLPAIDPMSWLFKGCNLGWKQKGIPHFLAQFSYL